MKWGKKPEGRNRSHLVEINERNVLLVKDGLTQNCEVFSYSFNPDYAKRFLSFMCIFNFFKNYQNVIYTTWPFQARGKK